jgi:hypothetical protein
VLTAARQDQARQVLADEDGVRYVAMFAARGNTPGPAGRAAIAAARAELDAIGAARRRLGRTTAYYRARRDPNRYLFVKCYDESFRVHRA